MTNFVSDNVSVVRTSDNRVVGTVPVGSLPNNVAITPDGAFAYVTNFGSENVSVIRTGDNTVIATVGVGEQPEGVAITPDGSFTYVANAAFDSHEVSVIRNADNTVVSVVTVGQNPVGVAITPRIEPCTLNALLRDVEALVAAGRLSQGHGHALSTKLKAALKLLERGNDKAAIGPINAFLNHVAALVRNGRLSVADAQLLREQATCVTEQLGR